MPRKKKKENIEDVKIQQSESGLDFDELFNEAAAEQNSTSAAELVDSTSAYLQDWFENNEFSFKNFNPGGEPYIVKSVTGERYRADITFGLTDADAVVPEVSDYKALMLPAPCIKSMATVINDFIPEEKIINEVNNVFIYGHNLDFDDEFSSRLDTELTSWISDRIQHKFKTVELSGAFASIESMQETIMTLYKKLTPGDFISHVKLHIDSKVKNDDGEIKTIAALVASGYIEPSVVRVPNVVEFSYKMWHPRGIDRLFTGEYRPRKKQNELLYG